jgi:murein hydrolase activator
LRFVIAVLLSLAALTAAADKKEELLELKGRIEALTKELADAEESKSAAAGQLRESERAISNANRELARLNTELKESNRELTELQSQRRALEREIGSEKKHLAALLRQMNRGQEKEALKLLLEGEDPSALSRDLAYYKYLAQARSQFLGSLKSNLEALETVTAAAHEKSAEIEDLQSRQAKEKLALEEQRRNRTQALQQLAKQIREQRSEISTLKDNEARLTQLIERLAKAAKPKQRPLENERTPQRGDQAGEFQRMKGKLSLPVKGELRNRFGAPKEDSDLSWKGLLILASPGAQVHAIAAGKVVFSDWLRGFGNLVILDHGEGYMSLYGHNETLLREVGDAVNSGDTVAEVGNTGGGANSGLYFEMRHQGKPFDPLDWVRLK